LRFCLPITGLRVALPAKPRELYAMATMHAVCIRKFGEADVLKVETVSVPEPAEDEIVIKVKAASVNPVDYKIRSGKYPAVKEDQLPKVLGRDVAGIVQAVGAGVSKFRPGDSVYAMLGRDRGGYAEFAVAKEDEAAAMPAKIDFVAAAAVPLAALTAWQGLFDEGHLKSGQRVLIHGGAGGVGHFAIQFAKAKGAWVATTVSGEDIELAGDLGADKVIDYEKQKFEDEVKDIDLVYDLIAGETQERSWKVLKNGGTMISTLKEPDQAKAKERDIHVAHYMAEPNADELEEITKLIDADKVKPIVKATYPLDQAAKAHKHMEDDHIQGKVVLKVAA
jgi:NADPH:quinone reductase-like Zn-dependent oxidoreductase